MGAMCAALEKEETPEQAVARLSETMQFKGGFPGLKHTVAMDDLVKYEFGKAVDVRHKDMPRASGRV